MQIGCRRNTVRLAVLARPGKTYPLGLRSGVQTGERPSLSSEPSRMERSSPPPKGRGRPCPGRPVGDGTGGRVQGSGRGRWGDPWGSERPELHGHETTGSSCAGIGHTRLADPLERLESVERRTRAMAREILGIMGEPSRSTSARPSALGRRTLPIPFSATRSVDR